MLSASFLDYIKKESLFNRHEHLLLAISGGLDSVVLAHLLKLTDFHFSMAHMNFQLRDEDSNRDEKFVRELAKKLEVEVFVKRVEIDKEKGSTQLQARDLRYDWFRRLMKDHHFSKLLTAHHANDLLETTLLNLIRGTGIKGLRSILPLHHNIARPLLFASKEQIKEYAEENSIEWREDVSNASEKYKRNKMRHRVIPLLLKENPNLLSGIQQTTLRLRAAESVWDEKLAKIRKKYVFNRDEGIRIDRRILKLPQMEVFLYEFLSDYGFNLAQLQSFKFRKIGAQLSSFSHTLVIDRGFLLVNPISDEIQKQFFPIQIQLKDKLIKTPLGLFKWSFINKNDVDYSIGNKIVFIEANKLKEPIELDLWKEGDKIQPIGMKGKKKISDILIDQKVPLPQKKKVMVLKSGGEIIWVIGHKFSDSFKVKKDTTKILRIEYENS
ncbi:tRNA(Ile)-lysidine synthase [Marivirga tractuosa]|uniref:tRNA(Ile)-lysidine synthase n=1 Tax=Marivirga tractuosa (strain ATCC 23168 / DSM 4126 / NBRC 15989 / NCIMB 1408 / VKM B-1430 / H-43) TaxID=643867 RepID=E4TTQ1_MARTH|nr:tRNA lysidine(34) synthetase TilS [Marivirga tractuosa]ADR20968.1 tRNA(Ile)-lysidine synthetase [Marivirga tractuosa DSM 4126]BDD14581.1 tRNA(Ile)-lysidine synthase [Marivirga tractuosa]